MAEQHTILGGKVYVYKRRNSSRWQCSSFFAGKNRRTSTKEESLSKAKEIAEDWYLQLRGSYASKTTEREIPSCSAKSRVEGSREPGASLAERTALRSPA